MLVFTRSSFALHYHTTLHKRYHTIYQGMKRYCYAPIPFALLYFSSLHSPPPARKNQNASSSIPGSHHIHKVYPVLLFQFLFIPRKTTLSHSTAPPYNRQRRKCNSTPNIKLVPPFYHNCTSTTQECFPSQQRE